MWTWGGDACVARYAIEIDHLSFLKNDNCAPTFHQNPDYALGKVNHDRRHIRVRISQSLDNLLSFPGAAVLAHLELPFEARDLEGETNHTT